MWTLTTKLCSDESVISITQTSSIPRLWDSTKSFHPGPVRQRFRGSQWALCVLPSVSSKISSVGLDGSISEHLTDKNCTRRQNKDLGEKKSGEKRAANP